nr:MAG TPA: DNA ligase IV [Caudoviricetes sp.]
MFRATIRIYVVSSDKEEIVHVLVFASNWVEAMERIVKDYQDDYTEILSIDDFKQIAYENVVEIDKVDVIDALEKSIQNW